MAFTFRGSDRLGGEAARDMKQLEFHAGRLLDDDAGRIDLCAGNPGRVTQGILIGNPELGGDATLQIQNIQAAIAGGAVARETQLVPDARGRLVAGVAGPGVYSCYRSLEAATVDGQRIAVKIHDPILV